MPEQYTDQFSQSPQPGAPKRGMFGSKEAPSGQPSSLPQELNVINTRLRVAEERFNDLRQRLQLVEQNLLLAQKKSSADIKSLAEELTDFKRTVSEVENKIVLVIKELQLAAKQEDVGVLKRYVEMWSPVSFVTSAQVERIAKEVFQQELLTLEGPKKQQAPYATVKDEIDSIFEKKKAVQQRMQREESVAQNTPSARSSKQSSVDEMSPEDAALVEKLLNDLKDIKTDE